MRQYHTFKKAAKLTALICLITILVTPFVIVNAGERGVLMKFGEVQDPVLGEGIHLIIPVVNTVKKLSIRIQKQSISTESISKDLQNIFTQVVLNWHIQPIKTNLVFQKIGDEKNIIDMIIDPAIAEVVKAIVAQYTAEEIITKREDVKNKLDDFLKQRLDNYYIVVDDVSLVNINFSHQFIEAVEAKQVAAQEAKRAEFLAIKASKEAEAKVNLAKGEAESLSLLKNILTPELLQRQALEKWNGKLPLIMGKEDFKIGDIQQLITASEN